MTLSNRLANFNWISLVFYPLMVVLMETLWLYPWLVWMTKWPNPDWSQVPLSLGAMLLLIIGSFITARYFPDRKAVFILVRLLIILALLFGVLSLEFGAHYRPTAPFVAAVLAGIYLCWRGISLGRSVLYFGDTAGTFIFGLVALVLLIIIWDVSLGGGSFENLASTVGMQVAGFFFCGLLVLALGNLQDIQRQVAAGSKGALSIRRWLPIQLGIVAGITLLGIGVASAFSSSFVAFLSRIIGAVLHFFVVILGYVLLPFDWLAQLIGYILQWLFNLLHGGKPPKFETPPLFNTQLNQHPNTALPPDLLALIKWTLFTIAAIVVVTVLTRALMRYRAARVKTEVDEVQESLGGWRSLGGDIRLLLGRMWRRLWKRRVPEAAAEPAWQYSEVDEEGLDIREIYRRLLWEGAGNGVKRRDYETPDEYARRLRPALPEGGEQLNELTGLYLAKRYGDVEEPTHVQRANGLWRLIHRWLRKDDSDS